MSSTNPPKWQPITETGGLSEGINPVSVEGIELVVVKKKEALSVFAGRCIHQEAPMAQGILEEDHLVCSKHLWRYRLDTGELEGEPGIFLQKFESQLQGQTLEIRRDAFDQLKELYNSYDNEDDEAEYRP